jgi:hypothetical protein
MRHKPWGALAIASTLVSCSFSAQELEPGTPGADASIPIFDAAAVIDGEVVDGALADGPTPDAHPPDAMSTPDARPDECSGGSAVLPLSTSFATFAAPVGDDSGPSCAAVDNLDSAFRVDLAPTGVMDFVVDVAETPGNWDSVLDVSTDCDNGAGATCADLTNGGHGELVVIPAVSAGRRYVTVDTYGNSGVAGAYQMRAFLRPVRGLTTTIRSCDPAIVTSRCDSNSYCLDLDGNGSAQCEAATPLADGAGNSTCGTGVTLTGDGVFAGNNTDAADDDYVNVDPPGDGKFGFRATLYTPDGACAGDFRLQVRQGADCDDVGSVVAEDDDSGLGACPSLLVDELDGPLASVRVFRRTYAVHPVTTYTLVIDVL